MLTRSNRRGYYKRKANGFQKGVRKTSDNAVMDIDSNPGPSELSVSNSSKSETESSHASTNQIVRPIQRHNIDYFNDLVINSPSNELSIPGADGTDGTALLLRPKPNPENNQEEIAHEEETSSALGEYNIQEGNILVEKSMLLGLINTFTRQHQEKGACDNLCLDLIEFRPWGVFCSVILTCTACDMKSQRTKLYEEIPTTKQGRKYAAGNIRLALMSQDMPIGPTAIQLLFAAVGLRAGSLTGLQKNAYKAAEITEGVARRDMEKWIEHAKDILTDRGAPDPSHISAQFDVLYHSVNKSNAQCPGQGAAQATATCVETITPSKKVIGYDHVNKACLKGARLKGRGTPVICGHTHSKDHHGCTATQPRGQGIREYDMAGRIAKHLNEQGVSVTHLCTDSDGTAKNAFSDFNQKDVTLPPLRWYKDPSHLSRNMRNKITNHKFKVTSFGVKSNGKKWCPKEKNECKKALALDVPRRVSLTLSNMRLYWKGDCIKMKMQVDKIVGYMMKCYGGDHSSCKSSQLARLTGCAGSKKGKCWFSRSHTLRAQGVSSLCLTEDDQCFLSSVIRMKLSPLALDYVSRGETSSKCEATNRAINRSLPKNQPFPRTSRGRVCSAIGRINNSLLRFTDMKLSAMGCLLRPNSLGYKVLCKYQHKRDKIAFSQKRKEAIERRHALTAEKTAEHFAYRKQIVNQEDYHKYQLDRAQQASTSALDAILSCQPGTSSSYENVLQQARSSALHRHESLEQSYSSSIASINSKQRSQHKRKAAARARNERKNEARAQGSKQDVSLRQEHSYGKL